ncbi:DUF6498-containing protein [Natronobacterium texcoconense]|uniref:Uncharacterized protein n=1 Tax=Natronobacterium texcoconense TaxID=1095778 RepID=A0A1H1B3K7_NATTX|nr:DUF6498-containing protein [Natronobacterium texcoconense]SDQ46493.1 hypothetical protein SAMN04489842_0910 [Natronobacterium texcoconense]
MAGSSVDPEYRIALTIIVGVNLFPLVGFVLFDWEPILVGLLYWLDVVSLVLVYSVCALFAQRWSHTELEEKSLLPGTVGLDYWSDEPRNLSRSLPPVYTRNLAVIIPTALFLLFVLFAVGAQAFFGDIELGRRVAGDAFAFLGAFGVFATLEGVVTGAVIIGAHAITIHRAYFRTGKYRDQSAYMVLESTIRFVLLYVTCLFAFLFYLVLVLAVGEFVVTSIVSETVAQQGAVVVLAASFLAVKLALERMRLRAEWTEKAGLTSWFRPSPLPESDDANG